MSELVFPPGVLPIALGLQALAGVLIGLRLLSGPSMLDRAVAVDALTLLAVAVIATVALATGEAVLFDVAVVLAVVSVFGTLALALLFRASGLPAAAGASRGRDDHARAEARDSAADGRTVDD